MKLIFLISVFQVLILCSLTAQSDDTEYVTHDSLQRTSEYFQKEIIKHIDIDHEELDSLLSEWHSIAGSIEPLERVKILRSIANNSFRTTDNAVYYEDFITKYKYRITQANSDDYRQRYDRSRFYFDFVPLNSSFDSWTRDIAQELLNRGADSSESELILLLFSGDLDKFVSRLRQEDDASSFLYKKHVHSLLYQRRSEGSIKVYMGLWSPILNLKENFNSSFMVGAAFGFPLKLKYRVEAKIQVAINPDKQRLKFEFDNTVHESSDLSVISAGFRFTREKKLSTNNFLDMNAEINLGAISTTIDDGEDSAHSVETIDFGVGLGIKRLVGNNKGLGFESMIHFAPYDLNGKLLSNTGSTYISTNLFFSF